MKKSGRILALLLVLVTVIGALPLSIFAAEETPVSVTPAERDWEGIKTVLSESGFVPALYLDFENEDVGAVEASKLNEAGTSLSLPSIKSQYLSGKEIQLKNYRPAYSIANDGTDKALFLGNEENLDSNNDTYMDIMNNGVARGNDIFVSVDFKMGGKNIATCNASESLLCFINRDNGRFNTPTVWVSNVGGLYLGNSFTPENLIGFLSDTEYTSISLHVKLSENKFYVYINDILVTPEGRTFLTVGDGGKYNGTAYTVSEYYMTQIRVYNSTDNLDDTRHSGMYMDNIILAGRAQMKSHNTEKKDIYVSDLSGATVGKALVANEQVPGTAISGVNLSVNAVLPSAEIITYIKDGSDTVIKYGKPSGYAAVSADQSYMSVFGLGSISGKNYSISAEFKMGTAMLGSNYQLINPINRKSGVTGADRNIGAVMLMKDGTLTYNSVTLGRASTEKYTKVTVCYECNDKNDVKVHIFVDGDLKLTASPLKTPWLMGAAPSEFFISDIALFCGYTSSVLNMTENELYVKSVAVKNTDAYNSGEYVEAPFKREAVGLTENAKILRYYNEDGSFKTESFTEGGENYTVGYNGNIIGKESDGGTMSYADYFTCTYTYGADTNVKIAESLDASCITNSTFGYLINARNAYNYAAVVDGGGACYCVSYKDAKTQQDSYWDYNTPSQANGTSFVFEFDIMLDAYWFGEGLGVKGLVTTKGLDANGERKTLNNDTYILSLNENGWLTSGDRAIQPIGKNGFTKISVVIKAPTAGTADGEFDVYVNGVLMVEDRPLGSGVYGLQGLRCFQSNKQSSGMYLKNIAIYDKAEKPICFRTMEGGSAVLTYDAAKNPAKPSDIKSGLLFENGVYRYYDETGLPIINGTVNIGGTDFAADHNGRIACNGKSHFGTVQRGYCSVCKNRADGVSAIYGNSLVLGSDVKVVFYLDISDATALTAFEIGRESDFAAGKAAMIPINEAETVKIAGKTYYKIGYGVPAKDLNESIKVAPVFADGGTGTEYTYSAREYMDAVKAHETDIIYSAELKALISALETYGALAEKELTGSSAAVDISSLSGINAQSFTASGVTVASASIGTANTTAVTSGNPNGLRIRTRYTLSLESNIKMIFSFKIEAGKISDYIFKIDGTEVTPREREGGLYYVENAVSAANLNKVYTLTVDNNYSQRLVTLKSSVLGFALNNLNESADETHQNLMKAIYKYWKEATMYKKYINSEDNSVVTPEGIQSVLAGKTVYSFGDSLLDGHYTGRGMIDGLTEQYGMSYTKYAKNGSRVTVTATESGSIYAQVKAASSVCPDFIVFDGLANDLDTVGMKYTLGSFGAEFSDSYDLTTFCGSFEATIKLMKEKYPTARIIYVTPHNMPTRHAATLESLVDTTVSICEKWGVSVVDIYHDGDIDTNNADQRNTYSDAAEGTGSGTHLTGDGYNKFYAPLISKKMAELISE